MEGLTRTGGAERRVWTLRLGIERFNHKYGAFGSTLDAARVLARDSNNGEQIRVIQEALSDPRVGFNKGAIEISAFNDRSWEWQERFAAALGQLRSSDVDSIGINFGPRLAARLSSDFIRLFEMTGALPVDSPLPPEEKTRSADDFVQLLCREMSGEQMRVLVRQIPESMVNEVVSKCFKRGLNQWEVGINFLSLDQVKNLDLDLPEILRCLSEEQLEALTARQIASSHSILRYHGVEKISNIGYVRYAEIRRFVSCQLHDAGKVYGLQRINALYKVLPPEKQKFLRDEIYAHRVWIALDLQAIE